jgi:putative nucleotidyltransferase with HDIG domain
VRHWSDFTDATTRQIVQWSERQPWAVAMKACRQDAEWHAEGDVWTHTCLVIHELERLPEWNSLDRSSQLKLLFTALFHDAGKPQTTIVNPETGRVHAPHHSQVGMEMVRHALRELQCDLVIREEIAQLVRCHGRPPFLLEKADPTEEVISLSWLLSHRLLYLFALADTRGRLTREMARPEETLHFWRMVAEEQECLDNPYRFANDHARFLYYRDELTSRFYTPFENYRCTVTMMSGLPGVGKDTWLKQHRAELPTVSLDEIRDDFDVEPTDNQGEVIQEGRERCREYLRASRDFAFNATNVMRSIRRKWIDLFADYGACIEIVYIEPPLEGILAQNAQRPKPVPERIIHKLLDKLEPPTWAEAHALTMVGGTSARRSR